MLRSIRTLTVTGVMIGLITQLFKYLYNKEEEEPEDKAMDLAVDVIGSTVNVLPIFSEFTDKMLFDYDMSINVLDVANDTLEVTRDSFALLGKQMSGEYVSDREALGAGLKFLKTGASFFGIPVNPAERTITGIIRRVSPATIYGYDNLSYSPNYTADLKAAVEKGDSALSEHILGTIYKQETTGSYTTEELEEVTRLYLGGHTSVLPQKIGKDVDGVTLSAAQRKQFNKIYSKATDAVNALIDSAYYAALSDEQRAKAIKDLYSMYYNKAASEVVGREINNAVAYSYLTNNYSALYAAKAYKSGLEEVKGNDGKKVSVKDQFTEYLTGLGLSESDYLVVSYANGYKDKTTKAAFIDYVNSLSLSAEVLSQIAERLGFAVEGGVMVEKSDET